MCLPIVPSSVPAELYRTVPGRVAALVERFGLYIRATRLVSKTNDTNRTWTFCERTVAGLNYVLRCHRPKMQGYLLRRQGQLMGYFIIGTGREKGNWEARLLDLMVNSA